jgi:hypothetical protein
MRKPHTLTVTKAKDRPNNVIFFDTETKQVQVDNETIRQVLDVGYVIRTRTVKGEYLKIQSKVAFNDITTFWNKIDEWIRDKTKTYLVAHNVVFDLVVVNGFIELTNRGWELVSFYSKGMTSIFRWRKDSKHLIILDNTNFFPGKLGMWGELIGVPKLDIDFETATKTELLEYNIRDVVIMVELWRLWLSFLDDNDCGAFKFTIPATALNTFRHRFMKHKIFIHNNQDVLELERLSYKGGRTEVFRQGEFYNDKFYYLDVNNLYGYILKTFTMPTALYGHSTTNSIGLLSRRLAKYLVVADVTLLTSDNPFPHKVNGHTAYPVGEYRTVLTTPELALAIRKDWISQVHSFAWYRHAKIFSDYVKYFKELRDHYKTVKKDSFANIAKLFVNSLYGKFGQLGLEQVQVGETDLETIAKETIFDLENNDKYWLIYLAGIIFKETKQGESYNSFPAIASHVTGYARMYMYKILRTVPRFHVFYMDTDSVIVDSVGYNSLKDMIDDKELGKLKIELSSDYLIINAPKDYQMEGRKRTKGIRDNAIEISDGTFQQEQWCRLDGMIHRGNVTNYYVKTITKEQRRDIYSGEVSPSGWVLPFRLPLPLQSERDV